MKLISSKELLFQVVLNLIVLLFYAYDQHQQGIIIHRVVFFANYVIAASLVSYWLLPQFYYTKKYIQLFIYFAMIVAGVILVEELVLEKIFFPDTRGTRFPGIFFSLLDVLPTISILSGFKF
ncbi:MAG: histidine kinase, partial [Bacteroidota bacterium]